MSGFFDNVVKLFESLPYLKTVILSLLLLIFATIIKKLLVLNIAKKNINRPEKIFLQKKISQYTNYLFLIFLFILWFSQLQVVFVSFVAVAAAVVVATKEIIMCAMGGIYLRQNNLFKEGHRIEIDNIRGFVVERLFLTTKVLEIGPEKYSQQTTGDVVSIPNSIFLSKSLKNESYFKGYSIKSFQFKLNINENIDEFEVQLLQISNEICASYIENATRSISNFCEKEGILIPSLSPRTKIVFENDDKTDNKVIVLLKIPVKNTQIADIEQSLNRLVLSWKKMHSGNISRS
ncbi:MAG: mechanosensitive ion channel [Halobacteriovoraceae bacterium]|nr:mechanosensitive ion channel [Halobacteriovoraceae bacterium]